MTGIVLTLAGASLAWFLSQKGDDLEMSDDAKKVLGWVAYGVGGLGILMLMT
ncbi:hypothetical protein PAF17_15900 [Paracoccus sp. Z330]|uniref:Uncharacterized protein n=1 Tax=Paracoccus onchidii TaxID=3017813 RepID=A0ABT4ZHY9_9RHOB|nr:hypothetical protein [Paracoccus onchidii]MDB6178975.1 hypothetical protein [Paracoccus onchidii]